MQTVSKASDVSAEEYHITLDPTAQPCGAPLQEVVPEAPAGATAQGARLPRETRDHRKG